METLTLLTLLCLGAVSSQYSFTCNLLNKMGCVDSIYFKVVETGPMVSGGMASCKNTFELDIEMPSQYNGLECHFSAQYPQGHVYSISHQQGQLDGSEAAILHYPNFTLIKPASTNDNWLHRKLLGPGVSNIRYTLTEKKLVYYSPYRDYRHQMGHVGLFTPKSKKIYIGLNRHYGLANYGAGLCAVQCIFRW